MNSLPLASFLVVSLLGMQVYPGGVDVKKPTIISGEELRAIVVAEQAFQKNAHIPKDKKDLRNYDVQILADSAVIEVTFVHHGLPEETQMTGGQGRLGVTVSFFVRRRDWTVEKTLFYQ